MSSCLASLRIYVLKSNFINPTATLVEASIRVHGGAVASSPDQADLIVTNLAGSRARLTSSLKEDAGLMDSLPIVRYAWLLECIRVGEVLDPTPYLVPTDAAHPHPAPADLVLAEALQGVMHIEPRPDEAATLPASASNKRGPSPSSPGRRTRSRLEAESPPDSSSRLSPKQIAALPTPENFEPHSRTPLHLIPADGSPMDPSTMAKYSCQRLCPRYCPNQELVDALEVIKKWKVAGEDEGDVDPLDKKHSLSYKRAIASIKSYPTRLRSSEEAAKLPFVGTKISQKIDEFISKGRIAKAEELRTDAFLRTTLLFQTVHGCGPKLARELWSEGCRTLEDLNRARPGIAIDRVAWGESQSKIPRSEVEDIAALFLAELETFSPGCTCLVAGGYRRGKELSNDIDLIFTHPSNDDRVSRGKLEMLFDRLVARGIILSTVSGAHIGISSQGHHKINQSFCVMRIPQHEGSEDGQYRRRVDVIFSTADVYYCAVVGWTGSTMFERDLRRIAHAKSPGYKFDSSGIARQRDRADVLIPPSEGERGIFRFFGLEWREPWERCADA